MNRRVTGRVPPGLAVIVAGVILAATAGCAGSEGGAARRGADHGSRPTTTDPFAASVPYPGAGKDCPMGEPSPISLIEATTALRENGFSATVIERSCGLRAISAVLTNASAAHGALEREGALHCFVLVEPRDGRQTVAGDTAAASAERRLANLQCKLFGREKRGFLDDVRRLDQAFVELERAIRP